MKKWVFTQTALHSPC